MSQVVPELILSLPLTWQTSTEHPHSASLESHITCLVDSLSPGPFTATNCYTMGTPPRQYSKLAHTELSVLKKRLAHLARQFCWAPQSEIRQPST